MNTRPLNASQPVIGADGTMEQPFRERIMLLSNNLPIVGTGSPEGIIEALHYSLYIDSAGTTGTIEWRKMQTEIAGDRAKGWVLV